MTKFFSESGFIRFFRFCFEKIRYKLSWIFLVIYFGFACVYFGFEINIYAVETLFFRITTLLLFFNTLWVMLLPVFLFYFFMSKDILYKNSFLRNSILFFNSIYFHFVILLSFYKFNRKIDFDFYFFWYNTWDALPTLWKLYAPLFPVFTFSIIVFVFYQKLAFSPLVNALKGNGSKWKIIFIVIFSLSILCQIITIRQVRGSAIGFFYSSFFSDRQIRDYYSNLYLRYIDNLRSSRVIKKKSANFSILGDFVFFIKQESLNGYLVRPKITPQIFRAAKDGILFNRFYGNSVQSVRGYENILCGVPSSITTDLVDDYPPGALKDLPCIPKIFKEYGYHTLYFFGGSKNPRIRRMALSIGFEKFLADDIVKPGDIKFEWGYREDIFFSRIDEYLRKNYSGDKLFVFIDTGATNHIPFKVLDPALQNKVPFHDPQNFTENLSNTTFVQDSYLGKFYNIFKENYSHRGSMVVVSDHAWPIMMHKDNIYNERGTYDENFVIAFLFVPPSPKQALFRTGKFFTHRYSQMDIYPTILDLIGMECSGLLGESFASLLLNSQISPESIVPKKTKISIQPYGGGFISAVRYPHKFLFSVLEKNVKVYNLKNDPYEKTPKIYDARKFLYLLSDFFQIGDSTKE